MLLRSPVSMFARSYRSINQITLAQIITATSCDLVLDKRGQVLGHTLPCYTHARGREGTSSPVPVVHYTHSNPVHEIAI